MKNPNPRYKDPEYMNNWRKENRQKYNATFRRWSRTHILHTNGRNIRILKRNYPEDDCCELCGIRTSRCLRYHHWDDTDLGIGMWICSKCHNFAHGIEDGYLARYIELKKRIENELAKEPLL